MKIDNEMYFRKDLVWWDENNDNTNALLRYALNPLRFNFFQNVLRQNDAAKAGSKILDLGCGGGFLSEEFAKAGFAVTGLDPSPHLLEEARAHAAQGGLAIKYVEGYGEKLPFADGSFDFVACCDVLEHVEDVDRVIGEIARVLKPAGYFFFDTVNRTVISWLLMIKIAQDWKFTAWEAPRTHVWPKFVKPAELDALLKRHGLDCGELRGIEPGQNPLSCLIDIRRRAQGKLTRRAMAERMRICESKHLEGSYMGYAVKK